MTQALKKEYPALGLQGRQIKTLTLPTFDTPLNDLVLPNAQFVCLLCSDAHGVAERTIIELATQLLDSGLVYLCAWGPKSTYVRNLFEGTALVWNSQVAVLTVDLHEALDDALDYLLDIASPAMNYTTACQTGIILNIGRTDWEKHIQHYLDNRVACL